MRYTTLALAICLFIVGCSPTPEQIDATSTRKANEIQSAIDATAKADMANAPSLKSPDFDASFPSPPIELQWVWNRELRANEVFDIRLGINGKQRESIYQTQDTHFDLTRWLRYENAGKYSWTVQVITVGNDRQIRKPVSPEASPREFTVAMPVEAIPTDGGPDPEVKDNFSLTGWGRIPNDELGLNKTSAIAFGADNNLYLLTLDGDIFQLPFELDKDKRRKAIVVYLDKLDEFQLAEGIAFHNDVLYIADAGRISTLTDSDGDGKLDKRTTISENLLPDTNRLAYSNSAIVFGGDGKLYVGVSALTDHQATTESNEAAILQMNPDGSDPKIYATGLRDVDAMTFSPDGDLFALDNPPHQLDNTLQYLPSGELNLIQQGKAYGFPNVFGDLLPREYFNDPIAAGEAPIATFPATNVARGLAYHAGNQVLPEGVYVALSGTIPTAYYNSLPVDRMIILVSLQKSASGVLHSEWQPITVFNHSTLSSYEQPVDVAIGSDGALYVATDVGLVYRLTKTS